MSLRTDDTFVIGLAGNPNTGKSSIFNSLTGSSQHVGNWPGKTVARAYGTFSHAHMSFSVVDLPGTYSLNASSPEEAITRDYLISGEPEAVVVVVDASNIERNLYLAVQIIETALPTIIALNMVDVARKRGTLVDVDILAADLGVAVIPTVARRGQGIALLVHALLDMTVARRS